MVFEGIAGAGFWSALGFSSAPLFSATCWSVPVPAPFRLLPVVGLMGLVLAARQAPLLAPRHAQV
jgi:hypothetical protein